MATPTSGELVSTIQNRFLFTTVSNGIGGFLTFASGMVIARVLGPQQFGTFTFLQGCFTSLIMFGNLGTSTAFFTFISQTPRGLIFYLTYAGWTIFQLVLLVLFVLLSPLSLRHRLHLDHPTDLLLLAGLASFATQVVWATISQIGDSKRDTFRVQVLNIACAGGLFISCLLSLGKSELTLAYFFKINILFYLLAGLIYSIIGIPKLSLIRDERKSLRGIFSEFQTYCRPLVLFNLLSVIHNYIDIFLLEYFAGSIQQGFYSVGFRIAAVSSIFTRSVTQIFWKEIAEAHYRGEREKVKQIYKKVSVLLSMGTALLCCFPVPFAKEILRMAVGEQYATNSVPLAIMLLYPIFTALGVVNQSMLYAMGQTRKNTQLGAIFMGVSFVMCFILLAPPTFRIPGLGLGATGLSMKMVICCLFHVVIMMLAVESDLKVGLRWGTLVIGVVALLVASFAAKFVVEPLPISHPLLRLTAALPIYLCLCTPILALVGWVYGIALDLRKPEGILV